MFMEPTRLFVIIGDPTEAVEEPGYPTDPRHYHLPLFREPVSDEEFDRAYRTRVKAFIEREHAIQFAWGCNMIGVRCPVYERVNGQWVYSESETEKMAEDLSAY
jgi:hypothetical protein